MSRPLELRLLIINSLDHSKFCALHRYYEISYADNTASGLALAGICRPALIIIDSGQEENNFRLQLKKRLLTNRIPVLRIITREELNARPFSFAKECDDFIVSPFQEPEFVLRVQMMIGYRTYFLERYINFLPERATENSCEKFLKRIKRIVEENLDKPLFGVADLAMEAGVSQPQLYRKLIALTGFSPNVYIRHIRLKHAAQLLSVKAGNVGEIACRVGFSSQSYFCKCFKAMHHQNPKQVLGFL